jgi:hypothetical protein
MRPFWGGPHSRRNIGGTLKKLMKLMFGRG